MSVEAGVPNLRIEEQTNGIFIPYSEFSRQEHYAYGTTITQVPPRELFTYQERISTEKIVNILGYVEEDNPLLSIVSGYTFFHTIFEENVIVVGNGNHRTLYAMENRKKVDVVLWQNPEPKDENPARFTNLHRKYGNIF